MSERELRMHLEDRLTDICHELYKGKDVELRTDANGVKVIAVKKEVVK